MNTRIRASVLAPIAFLLTAFADPEAKGLRLDGVASSQVTDVAYAFQCNEDRSESPIARPISIWMMCRSARRSATLSKLSVTRRQITRAGFEEADRSSAASRWGSGDDAAVTWGGRPRALTCPYCS